MLILCNQKKQFVLLELARHTNSDVTVSPLARFMSCATAETEVNAKCGKVSLGRVQKHSYENRSENVRKRTSGLDRIGIRFGLKDQ